MTLSVDDQIRRHYRDQIAAVLEALCVKYPNAFQMRQSQRVPLKADIINDLRQRWRELGDVTVDGLIRAVNFYCASIGYLDSLRPGASRVDLAGSPAGVVTGEEAMAAKAEKKAAWTRQAEAKRQEQWNAQVDAVDLAQWFDVSQPINRDDLEAAVSQMMLDAVKDGLDPDDDGCRREYRKMRLAVKRHNARMRQEDELQAAVNNELIDSAAGG
jgi:sRNA-binding protein